MIPGMYSNDWDPNDPQGTAMSYAPAKTPAPAPPPQQPPEQPTPDSGGTQQGIKDQWSEFMGRPETRAGLMQFAVNMLSGRGLGESIGGAAAATGRNVAAQEEEQKYEEAQALKEREAARKEQETEYYGIGQRKAGSAEDRYYAHQDALFDRQTQGKARDMFATYKTDPGTQAAIWRDIQANHPELKGKKREDIPPAQLDGYARETINRYYGLGASKPAPRAAPPNSKVGMDKEGRSHYFDKTTNKYLGPAD